MLYVKYGKDQFHGFRGDVFWKCWWTTTMDGRQMPAYTISSHMSRRRRLAKNNVIISNNIRHYKEQETILRNHIYCVTVNSFENTEHLSWQIQIAETSKISTSPIVFEPRHEKTCFMPMQTTKAQISLRIRAVWSAPLLLAAWIV